MTETIFKIAFVVLFIIYVLIRVPFDKTYQKQEKINKLNSSREKILLLLMPIGLLMIPLLLIFTPFLNDFKIEFPIWLRI
jgi:archaellum biogenesis protein FlaJ (TadC family)